MNGMIVSDFKGLLKAFEPLIMGQQRWINDLYDIWKMGAPTPDSIIRNPKAYNPEHDITVKRVIPSLWLYKYLRELANTRGIPLSDAEIKIILEGK